MEEAQVLQFYQELIRWSNGREEILAIGLVGSYARGNARPDSDVDLIILLADPQPYLQDTDWASAFGTVVKQQVEDYGIVTSLRVWYSDGLEVEFGLTRPDWAALPLDKGTAQVIAGGMRILFEREALLSRVLRK